MSLTEFFKAGFAEHRETMQRSEAALQNAFVDLVEVCVTSIRAGGKLMFFGNGGSAADAQHLATELTIRYEKERPAIAAIALTTDTSAITAAANDYGFERIFARQIEALGKPGDVAIGISTSGKSPNVIAALQQAKTGGLVTAALSGNRGGELAQFADHLLVVPSDTTARIQEMHILLGHLLCEALEGEVGNQRQLGQRRKTMSAPNDEYVSSKLSLQPLPRQVPMQKTIWATPESRSSNSTPADIVEAPAGTVTITLKGIIRSLTPPIVYEGAHRLRKLFIQLR